MSIYAYFNCHDCRQRFCLGKALHENHVPFAFHMGNDPTPQWKREDINKVIWKLLANHTSHNIDVLLESQMTEEFNNYQVIGGDEDTDISIKDYLRDWKYKLE